MIELPPIAFRTVPDKFFQVKAVTSRKLKLDREASQGLKKGGCTWVMQVMQPQILPLINLFPEVRVEFWFGSFSDHVVMLVSVTQIEQIAKPISLFDSWLKKQEFLALARTRLTKPVCGNGLYYLQQKLKEVKLRTKEWAAAKSSDAKQITTTREALDKLVKELNFNPLSSGIQLEIKK